MGVIQSSVNQVLGTAATAAFGVNKTLEPAAEEFKREAEKNIAFNEGQKDLALENQTAKKMERVKLQPELDAAEEAAKQITSVEPEEARQLTGASELSKKMSDLSAQIVASENLRMKSAAKIADRENQLRHSGSIKGKLQNQKDYINLRHENKTNDNKLIEGNVIKQMMGGNK